jgi:hypothetical protein
VRSELTNINPAGARGAVAGHEQLRSGLTNKTTPADQTAVDAMWASYVADSGYDGPLVTAFAFGDSAELADELGLLVLHGPKRATAELVQAFAAQ